ncbi:type II secretion system protein GspM [Serratia sp. L9]|uniref:type II secretion system protein GspM n=1 Tax=Serratia sp. L9 TaxID=3423946 RepID=UPI003D67F884
MTEFWAAWRQRSARERGLMLALLGIVAAVGLWQGAWLPLQQAIAGEHQRQQQLRLQWQQLQRLVPQSVAEGDLRQRLATTVAKRAIVLQSLTERQGQMQVVLAKANADDVLSWLAQLESQGVCGWWSWACKPPHRQMAWCRSHR